ncbi:hypothetical protein BO99DRAFT_325487 [Aspergillus violaceofuscus CBS 115571]|uniref:Uncharacterized protein n=1 Tax=Aspergillus violaceofuscus (strain CBS 115571) TaxID=1450538 RepID=A0A2V5I2I0_ASPV1|nr:hypothetical protein BO99DRAFT_325487 [Aspergillus violaceofuscus CBS 115571]
MRLYIHIVNRIMVEGFYTRDNEDGITVQAELAPLGERHPKVFVSPKTTNDPASRLAFRVTLKDEKGEQKVLYLTVSTNFLEAIFKINSLVDWLDGATIHDLKARRRRHIYIHPSNKNLDDDLRNFLGGGYILDDG